MSAEHTNAIIAAINEFDAEGVKAASVKALEANISPIEIIQQGIAAGLLEIGKKFEKGELFVTHLVAAAEAAKAAITEVIEPEIKKSGSEGVGGPSQGVRGRAMGEKDQPVCREASTKESHTHHNSVDGYYSFCYSCLFSFAKN